MSKPVGNDFSTSFKPEALGVEITSIAASANTDPFGVDRFLQIIIELNISATAGVGPTLDVALQLLLPDETTWTDVATFAQLSATGVYVLTYISNAGQTYTDGVLAASSSRKLPLAAFARLRFTLGGSGGPSFTLAPSIRLVQ